MLEGFVLRWIIGPVSGSRFFTLMSTQSLSRIPVTSWPAIQTRLYEAIPEA